MAPQVNVDGTDRVAQAAPITPPTVGGTPVTRGMTDKDRHLLAMSWAFSALGVFALLAAIALGAALVFNAGFIGWLIGVAVMGLVIVVVIAAVNRYVLKPGH